MLLLQVMTDDPTDPYGWPRIRRYNTCLEKFGDEYMVLSRDISIAETDSTTVGPSQDDSCFERSSAIGIFLRKAQICKKFTKFAADRSGLLSGPVKVWHYGPNQTGPFMPSEQRLPDFWVCPVPLFSVPLATKPMTPPLRYRF